MTEKELRGYYTPEERLTIYKEMRFVGNYLPYGFCGWFVNRLTGFSREDAMLLWNSRKFDRDFLHLPELDKYQPYNYNSKVNAYWFPTDPKHQALRRGILDAIIYSMEHPSLWQRIKNLFK